MWPAPESLGGSEDMKHVPFRCRRRYAEPYILRCRHSLWILALLAIGCARPVNAPQAANMAADRPSTRPAPPSPVAAIWYDEISKGPPRTREAQRLIVGIWSDGSVVWSNDRESGGKPYLHAKIDPTRVDRLLNGLDAAGFFGKLRQVNFGPDSTYTVIAGVRGANRQWLGSWHDPARDGPNVGVTEHGLEVIFPGQPRPTPSPEYQHFLDVWAASRKLIEGAVPTDGSPVDAPDSEIYLLGQTPVQRFREEE